MCKIVFFVWFLQITLKYIFAQVAPDAIHSMCLLAHRAQSFNSQNMREKISWMTTTKLPLETWGIKRELGRIRMHWRLNRCRGDDGVWLGSERKLRMELGWGGWGFEECEVKFAFLKLSSDFDAFLNWVVYGSEMIHTWTISRKSLKNPNSQSHPPPLSSRCWYL
jgi:hypothetical protein